mgnify:CR=1 FL=1
MVLIIDKYNNYILIYTYLFYFFASSIEISAYVFVVLWFCSNSVVFGILLSVIKLGSIIEINTNITNSTQEDVTFDKSKPTERERISTETKTSSSGLEMGNVYNYKGVDYVYLFDFEGVSYYIDTVENDIANSLPTNLPIKKQFQTAINDDNGFIYVNNTDKKFIHIYTGKKRSKNNN